MSVEPSRVDCESAGGVGIAAYRWDPEGEPRAIVHEDFDETNRDEVIAGMPAWLDRVASV